MSLRRDFHCAINQLIALGAHGALEYALQEAQALETQAQLNEVQGVYMMATVDRDGRFLEVSDVLAEWMGRTREQLIGQTMYDVMPRHTATRRLGMIRKALDERRLLCFLDSNGGHAFKSIILPVRNESGKLDRVQCLARLLPAESVIERHDHVYAWERVPAT